MPGQLFEFDLQLLKCPVLEISYFDRACQPLNKRAIRAKAPGNPEQVRGNAGS
jgi:hypothetical protein